MREKREETRRKLDSVKSFEEIENSIILNPKVMHMLKEIASELGQLNKSNLTYSDIVAFLVKYYQESLSQNAQRGMTK